MPCISGQPSEESYCKVRVHSVKMADNTLLFAADVSLNINVLCSKVLPTIQQLREVTQKLSAAAANHPAWQQIVSSISQFAENHGGKVQNVGVAGGILISSFLLYKSVTLSGEIEGFFDGIEELKGQYKALNAKTASLIELYEQVPKMMMQQNIEPSAMRKFLKEAWKKSRDYFRNVQDILDAVEDMIQNVMKAKSEADVNARVSALVAIVAGTALVAGTPASMPVCLYRTGLVLTTGMSAGSTVLSLKNSRDAQRAYDKLKVLKGHLRGLREELDLLQQRLLDNLMED